MAANSLNITTSSTVTNSEFQAICTMISAVLDAGANTKTSDTGQGDPASATFPGSNSSTSFYEIRKFDDALDPNNSFVYRIDYRRGAGSGIIELGITAGKGSNGSGTITNQYWSANIVLNSTAANRTFIASAGEGRMLVAATGISGNQTSGGLISMERTHDSAGDDTDVGILVVTKTSSTTYTLYFPKTGSIPAAETYSPSSTGPAFAVPGQQTSGLSADNIIATFPVYCTGIGHIPLPIRNIMSGANSDFTNMLTATVKSYGQDQTMWFITTANITPSMSGMAARNVTSWGTLLRYE